MGVVRVTSYPPWQYRYYPLAIPILPLDNTDITPWQYRFYPLAIPILSLDNTDFTPWQYRFWKTSQMRKEVEKSGLEAITNLAAAAAAAAIATKHIFSHTHNNYCYCSAHHGHPARGFVRGSICMYHEHVLEDVADVCAAAYYTIIIISFFFLFHHSSVHCFRLCNDERASRAEVQAVGNRHNKPLNVEILTMEEELLVSCPTGHTRCCIRRLSWIDPVNPLLANTLLTTLQDRRRKKGVCPSGRCSLFWWYFVSRRGSQLFSMAEIWTLESARSSCKHAAILWLAINADRRRNLLFSRRGSPRLHSGITQSCHCVFCGVNIWFYQLLFWCFFVAKWRQLLLLLLWISAFSRWREALFGVQSWRWRLCRCPLLMMAL